MAATVTVGVTNANPVRTLVPRAMVRAQKTVDGLGYIVTKPDGSTVIVPLAVIDALYDIAPTPVPLMDRPKGASST